VILQYDPPRARPPRRECPQGPAPRAPDQDLRLGEVDRERHPVGSRAGSASTRTMHSRKGRAGRSTC